MKIRVYPKIKSFINGGYRYNPVIDKDLIDVHRECRADCTQWMGTWLGKPQETHPVVLLIGMRAHHARIERELRRRLIRGV